MCVIVWFWTARVCMTIGCLACFHMHIPFFVNFWICVDCMYTPIAFGMFQVYYMISYKYATNPQIHCTARLMVRTCKLIGCTIWKNKFEQLIHNMSEESSGKPLTDSWGDNSWWKFNDLSRSSTWLPTHASVMKKGIFVFQSNNSMVLYLY